MGNKMWCGRPGTESLPAKTLGTPTKEAGSYITPAYIANHLREACGVPPPKDLAFAPRGVCGRFIRGVKAEDFELLAEEPGKKLAFVCDEIVLRRCLECATPAEMMYRVIGFDLDWLKARLLDGTQHKLVVFYAGDEERFLCTWDNLLILTERVYGKPVHDKLAKHVPLLKSTKYEDIDPLQRLAELSRLPVSEKYAHNEFMTAERYMAAEDTLYSARGFYYHSLGANLRFSGEGILADSGAKEYCVVNRPIRDLDGAIVIDLDVTHKHLTDLEKSATV